MKTVAFNGSARKGGNTSLLMLHVLQVLKTDGIETKLIQLAGKQITGWNAYRTCFSTKNNRCIIDDDNVNAYVQKIVEADGIILGSPVYFSMMSPELYALIERAGYVALGNDCWFKRKVGAAVVAVSRAWAISMFDGINHFFLINQMIIPTSSYWNVGFGRKKGDVAGDEEQVQIMDKLGKNMVWLLKRLKA